MQALDQVDWASSQHGTLRTMSYMVAQGSSRSVLVKRAEMKFYIESSK